MMKTTLENLAVGTEIYYTGDMANVGGFGKVAKQVDDNWGARVDIVMNDGRRWKAIPVCSFDPSPGRRFQLKAEYIADRQKRIDVRRQNYIDGQIARQN